MWIKIMVRNTLYSFLDCWVLDRIYLQGCIPTGRLVLGDVSCWCHCCPRPWEVQIPPLHFPSRSHTSRISCTGSARLPWPATASLTPSPALGLVTSSHWFCFLPCSCWGLFQLWNQWLTSWPAVSKPAHPAATHRLPAWGRLGSANACNTPGRSSNIW